MDRLKEWSEIKDISNQYIGLSFKDNRTNWEIIKDAWESPLIEEIYNHIGRDNVLEDLEEEKKKLDKNYEENKKNEENLLKKLKKLVEIKEQTGEAVEGIDETLSQLQDYPIFKLVRAGVEKIYKKEVFSVVGSCKEISGISKEFLDKANDYVDAEKQIEKLVNTLLKEILKKMTPADIEALCKNGASKLGQGVIDSIFGGQKLNKFCSNASKYLTKASQITSWVDFTAGFVNFIIDLSSDNSKMKKIASKIVEGLHVAKTALEVTTKVVNVASGATSMINLVSDVSVITLAAKGTILLVSFGIKLALKINDGKDLKKNFLNFSKKLSEQLEIYCNAMDTENRITDSKVEAAEKALIELANKWCRVIDVSTGKEVKLEIKETYGEIKNISEALYTLGMAILYAEHTKIIEPSENSEKISEDKLTKDKAEKIVKESTQENALTHGEAKGALALIKQAEYSLEENLALGKYLEDINKGKKEKDLKRDLKDNLINSEIYRPGLSSNIETSWQHNFFEIYEALKDHKKEKHDKFEIMIYSYALLSSIKLSKYSFLLENKGNTVKRITKYISGNCKTFAKHGRILEYTLLLLKFIEKDKNNKLMQKLFGEKSNIEELSSALLRLSDYTPKIDFLKKEKDEDQKVLKSLRFAAGILHNELVDFLNNENNKKNNKTEYEEFNKKRSGDASKTISIFKQLKIDLSGIDKDNAKDKNAGTLEERLNKLTNKK